MTKFKVGDKVRIRNLTDEERYDQDLHYNENMEQYEGLDGTIEGIQKRHYGYIYLVKTKLGSEWLWMDKWLEEDVTYAGY